MKLVRFGPPGEERPGIWLENTPAPGRASLLDVRGMAFDLEDYDAHFFARWGPARLRGLLAESSRRLLPADGVRLGPPTARPGQIICLGKNYADHAAEFDAELPEKPILFSKAPSALGGPNDPIALPPDGAAVDTEVELAVVIGRTTRRAGEAEAMDNVAGFTILNDITERAAQRADKQWFRAKSFDTFCPFGPCLVTPDEVRDPQNLHLFSKINGRVLQDSNTSHMIFKIPYLIAYISAGITLQPGDVIATGTPGGIGSARRPPVLLRPGDTVEVGVEGLGLQQARVTGPGP